MTFVIGCLVLVLGAHAYRLLEQRGRLQRLREEHRLRMQQITAVISANTAFLENQRAVQRELFEQEKELHDLWEDGESWKR